jgi:hypothetical protein
MGKRASTKVFAMLLWLATVACGVGEETWFLLPEPKFMGHKVTRPIAGSKTTVLATALLDRYGPEFPSKEAWEMKGIADEVVAKRTRELAAQWLQEVKPEFQRDKKKVLQYARLEATDRPLAAIVFTPEFWRRFEETFGPKMRVTVPNRHTIFIFPDFGEDLQQYAPMVLRAWYSDHPKVSLEVFQVLERGATATGVFEEP